MSLHPFRPSPARVTLLLLWFATGPLGAEERRGVAPRDARSRGDAQVLTQSPASTPAPVRADPALEPWLVLEPAPDVESAQIADLIDWNASHRGPWQNGFSRRHDRPRSIDLELSGATRRPEGFAGGVALVEPDGSIVWRGALVVRDAYALRLELSATLPEGATLAVRGRPDDSWKLLATTGDSIWTPAIRGSDVELRVSLPAGQTRARVQIDELVELFELDERGAPFRGSIAAACTLDVSCTPNDAALSLASRAIGRMVFQSGGKSYVCTGGLIGDTESSDTPYFLTANHCISTASEAGSLDVTWNYRSSSCGGFTPNPASLPRTLGATLLATRSESDFTLLVLSSLPSNRSFLGWTTAAPGPSLLRRISHPQGGPQSYSETLLATTVDAVCSDAPRAFYLYEDPWLAGIAGGSSGSPVWIDDGVVVGQLSGTCGGGDCNPSTDTLDGRFARSYPYLQPWLDPTAGPAAPAALHATFVGKKRVLLAWTDTANDETRFEVWRSARGGQPVLAGTAGPDAGSFDVRGLKRATPYTFTVQACRDTGCSLPAAVSVRTKR